MTQPAPADDERWMRVALAEAQKALALGEVPVGAVAVLDGAVIGRGHNRKESDRDPTAHAEMLALRAAAAHLGNWRLIGVTLYCTLEPCPMCAGAMIQGRLARLVYGAPDIRFGADGTIVDVLGEPRFNHAVAVTRGVLADEAGDLLQAFFRRLRADREANSEKDAPRRGTNRRKYGIISICWRGARVVDRDALEKRCGLAVTVGSNPTLSAERTGIAGPFASASMHVLRLSGSQILVFHLPGVVERVKRGVANQVPQRPFRHLAGQLAL